MNRGEWDEELDSDFAQIRAAIEQDEDEGRRVYRQMEVKWKQ